MDPYRRVRGTKTLWVLVMMGMAYSLFLYDQRTLTGTDTVDGLIGVVLGLYVCSHPAANLVDMIFFRRGALRQRSSRRATVFWLGFNLLVLLIGWLVIFSGTTRLIGRPG